MDPEVLAKITPAVDRLEATEKDTFDAIAEVKIGPVKGNFKGQVKIKDKDEPHSFVLGIDQKSKIGNAKSDITITLHQISSEETEVAYAGQVRLSGVLATMGGRVIGGVVSMLSRQFFESLEREVSGDGQDA